MNINEKGEIMRSEEGPENQRDANGQLFELYSGISTQNTHPHSSEQPSDVFYWRADRLENVEQGLQTMRELTAENAITEISNPFDENEKVDIKEFIKKVEKSIAYSRETSQKLGEQPTDTKEDIARRREVLQKLMQKKDGL